MKIETILTPAELPALAQRDLRATACVVFDVLRATSTFVTALHHGAKAIIPVSEIAEALAFKKAESGKRKAENILLGGERDGVKIRANGIVFDFGNSPREFLPEKIRGKTIVSTTTNGTRALRACAGAKMVLASSFLNLSATAKFLREKNFENVLLVCAGTRENSALEDILAAGALCKMLVGRDSVEPKLKTKKIKARRSLAPPDEMIFSDSAQIALAAYLQTKSDLFTTICQSENARRLLAIPELRDDVEFCLRQNVFDFVAALHEDAIRIHHRVTEHAELK